MSVSPGIGVFGLPLGGPKKLHTRAGRKMRAAESLILIVIGVLGVAHLGPRIRRSVRKSIFRYVF